MLTLEDTLDRPGDRQEYQKFCLIADKIEADPALLQIPITTVDRWLAGGHRAHARLAEWKSLLHEAQQSVEGLSVLLGILRDDSESTRYFKGFAPFPGVLTPEDLKRFPCISRH